MHMLALSGSLALGRERMGLFGRLFRRRVADKGPEPVPVERPDQDRVSAAHASGDLDRMLAAVDEDCRPADRHFLLMGIVSATYKRRKEDPRSRALCEQFARRHVAEFPNFVEPLRELVGGQLPRVSTFKHLATILTEAGDHEGAIEICELALRYDLHDGTQGGFEGRIERIRKKGGLE